MKKLTGDFQTISAKLANIAELEVSSTVDITGALTVGGTLTASSAFTAATIDTSETLYRTSYMTLLQCSTIGATGNTLLAVNTSFYGYKVTSTDSVYAYYIGAIPQDYKPASTVLTPFFLHSATTDSTSGTGNMVWGLNYAVTTPNSTMMVASTATALNISATAIAGYVFASTFANCGSSGYTAGSNVMFRLARLSSATTDTHEGNSILIACGFHYLSDEKGTTTVWSKA